MKPSIRVLIVEYRRNADAPAENSTDSRHHLTARGAFASAQKLIGIAADFHPDVIIATSAAPLLSVPELCNAIAVSAVSLPTVLVAEMGTAGPVSWPQPALQALPGASHDDPYEAADTPAALYARLASIAVPMVLNDDLGWILRANDPASRQLARHAGFAADAFLAATRMHSWDFLTSLLSAQERPLRLPGANCRPARPLPHIVRVADKYPIRRRTQLTDDLCHAMQHGQIKVQYQPQFELDSGSGCGVEALARWTLPTGRAVSPASFIPLAERTGLIHELGAAVLQSACATATEWTGKLLQRTTLSVNVSALQINTEFCRILDKALTDTGFPPRLLELEITEGSLVRTTQRTIDQLKEWKQSGVQIAVDDFGTGYSSLSYLSRLPVDRLKLDGSLVQQMPLDAKSSVVVRSIVVLGADLGIDVIAEGVETEHQLRMLQNMGCPRAQGYLLGRPMSAEQVLSTLRRPWGNRPQLVASAARAASGNCHVW